MKLVIEIDEKEYIEICEEPCTKLGLAIANGTPLPKDHGRLIDDNQYKQILVGYINENKNSDDMFLAGCGDGAYHAMCMLKDAPTIIEADKGE